MRKEKKKREREREKGRIFKVQTNKKHTDVASL